MKPAGPQAGCIAKQPCHLFTARQTALWGLTKQLGTRERITSKAIWGDRLCIQLGGCVLLLASMSRAQVKNWIGSKGQLGMQQKYSDAEHLWLLWGDDPCLLKPNCQPTEAGCWSQNKSLPLPKISLICLLHGFLGMMLLMQGFNYLGSTQSKESPALTVEAWKRHHSSSRLPKSHPARCGPLLSQPPYQRSQEVELITLRDIKMMNGRVLAIFKIRAY